MKKIIGVILVILALGLAYKAFMPRTTTTEPQSNNNNNNNYVTATTTQVGVFTCLPHKGNGPSTMECAFGLKTDNGDYYALDWSGTGVSAFDFPMDVKYSVTGLTAPVETLNSDHWQIYDIRGIMKVSEYQELAKPKEVVVGSNFTVGLKEAAMVGSTTVRVQAVTEDSRCASDVQCIQAGRARIAVAATWAQMSSTTVMTIDQIVRFGNVSLKLTKVEPYPVSTKKIGDTEYKFTFTTSKAK